MQRGLETTKCLRCPSGDRVGQPCLDVVCHDERTLAVHEVCSHDVPPERLVARVAPVGLAVGRVGEAEPILGVENGKHVGRAVGEVQKLTGGCRIMLGRVIGSGRLGLPDGPGLVQSGAVLARHAPDPPAVM